MLSIVERYEKPLVTYTWRFTGDLARARDVVQDAFMKLWTRLDTIDRGKVGSWLFTVCRNRALDILRRDKRLSPMGEMQRETAPSAEPAPDGLAEDAETVDLAMSIISALPAVEQEILRLRLKEGFTYRQISKITGKSISNIGAVLHNAIFTIRREFKRKGLMGHIPEDVNI
jgi:RNA polymerase sigma-70 factor (ECF subfamily)